VKSLMPIISPVLLLASLSIIIEYCIPKRSQARIFLII
jgi:hypothetical protein